MTETEPIWIDNTDCLIIRLLQENGRMSSRDIAKRIGYISDRAVRYRIERLVGCRAIRLTAIVNADVIGLGVMGDVALQVDPHKSGRAAAALAEFDCVSYVATGGDDIVSITVNASDKRALADYLRRLIGRVDGVLGGRLLLVSDLVKDVDTWPPPESVIVGSHRVSGAGRHEPPA